MILTSGFDRGSRGSPGLGQPGPAARARAPKTLVYIFDTHMARALKLKQARRHAGE